jgi:predicted AAA+ superfamily ATPase
VRPFHQGGRQEIVSQPRVYAFDTGFVCHARGILELRESDCGQLLENLVLESLQSIPSVKVHYWRTKQQAEVDFVVPVSRDRVDAIECKWKSGKFDPGHLRRFREDYPGGRNVLVCSDAHLFKPGRRDGLDVVAVSPGDFRRWYEGQVRATG